VLFTHGAGLDVHQKTVRAGRVPPDPTGAHADGSMARQAFGALPVALLALSDWLAAAGITPIALASTGAYWKPRDNIWAGDWTVVLVNAAPVQPGPGRKTDTAAARWLATRMRSGLLRASFSPPRAQRDWRALTRDRTTLGQAHSREVTRVHGVRARATSQLASVATEIMGVSARALLAALVEGRAAPATMAALAKRRRRRKMPLLAQALTGLVRDQHRPWRARPWAHSDCLDEPSEALSAEMTRRLAALNADASALEAPGAMGEASRATTPAAADASMPFARAVTFLDTIPGVKQRGGELRVAAWGLAMGRVGTAARFAAWSGVAPGHHASAGKPRAGKTRQGNQAVRTGLTPWAHAAARTKGTSLAAFYPRLATRRGKTRASIAVAHAIVGSAFHRLIRDEPDRELGAHDLDDRRPAQLVDQLTRRIERLGDRVTLEPAAAA
jgi:hypothetical protein